MATGATEFIDNTTADVFIPELWSPYAIAARQNALVFANLVDRRFEEGLSFGDTIHVPSRGHLSTRTKSANSAITYETVTETNTDITIGTHEYAAIAVESITQVQSNREQLEYYSTELGYALGLAVDDVLAGLPDGLTTNVVGTLGETVTYTQMVRARQYLDDANVPQGERYLVVSPAMEAGLLGQDSFINNDYSNVHGELKETGQEYAYVGSFLGMPIYKSVNVEGTNAAGHDNTMFHRSTWALVMQMRPTMHQQYDIDYFVDKVAVEQLYGTKVMREDHGVWVKGA